MTTVKKAVAVLALVLVFSPAAQAADLGEVLLNFKNYLESVAQWDQYGYSDGQRGQAGQLLNELNRRIDVCMRQAQMQACLQDVGNYAYQSSWSSNWERDVGYYSRSDLVQQGQSTWFSGNQVPGLSCAYYTRGVGSLGAFIQVTETQGCQGWSGTYWWVPQLGRYCRSTQNCSQGYIDTVPPPP